MQPPLKPSSNACFSPWFSETSEGQNFSTTFNYCQVSVTYQEALFELFSKQFEMAKMDESREGAIPQVIDLATPPELKSKPQKAIIAILAALSSGFILLFVFVRQAMRNANKDADSAQKIQALKASLSRAFGK